jgi:hypothetical protein
MVGEESGVIVDGELIGWMVREKVGVVDVEFIY